MLIPGSGTYTVSPGPEGVEFLEMRTSSDYDTYHRAKTDAYWGRVAATKRARKDAWAKVTQPYGLLELGC